MGQIKNKDHLSPSEAEIGAELGSKTIEVQVWRIGLQFHNFIEVQTGSPLYEVQVYTFLPLILLCMKNATLSSPYIREKFQQGCMMWALQ